MPSRGAYDVDLLGPHVELILESGESWIEGILDLNVGFERACGWFCEGGVGIGCQTSTRCGDAKSQLCGIAPAGAAPEI